LSVETAIQAKLTADSGAGGVATLCTSGIHQGAPPEGTTPPYLNWQLIGGRPTEHTFTVKVADDLFVQFYAWAEDTDTAEGIATVRTIIDRVETILFDAALSVSGRTLLYCRKYMDLPDRFETLEGGQHRYGKGQQWRIEVS
jgi:hypothetical protein